MTAASTAPSRSAAAMPAAPARSVRWALARVESRRLLAHPLFMLGMATSVAALVLADSDAIERSSMLAGDCFVLFGAAIWTFLVAYLAASRERRDDAHDFYAAQPAPARLRTEATLLSLGSAGLAGAALIAVAALVLAGPDGTVVMGGQRYTLRLHELAQGPVYLVTAGAFGVLVGSWTRHVYAALLGALVLFLPPVALLPWYAFDQTISRGFYGAVLLDGTVPFEVLPAWHLFRLAGLTALAAAGALARHDRRPRIALLAFAGLAAVVTAAALDPAAEDAP